MSPGPPPRRLVSLVPSLTEALFALGLGDRVVGVTDWCVHPADVLAGVPRIGGTKDPDVEAVVRLAPDLVIANREENTERAVRQLRRRGLDVWVTEPRSVADGVALMVEMAERLGAAPARRTAVVEPLRSALARTLAAPPPRPRPAVFCPIWREPWMAVGAPTYADDVIRVCGGRNPFARPGGRRYPIVTLEDVVAAQPDVIWLPDEPYAFGAEDASELAALDVPAARSGRIHPIDGTLLTWYGPRIERALQVLPPLLRASP